MNIDAGATKPRKLSWLASCVRTIQPGSRHAEGQGFKEEAFVGPLPLVQCSGAVRDHVPGNYSRLCWRLDALCLPDKVRLHRTGAYKPGMQLHHAQKDEKDVDASALLWTRKMAVNLQLCPFPPLSLPSWFCLFASETHAELHFMHSRIS